MEIKEKIIKSLYDLKTVLSLFIIIPILVSIIAPFIKSNFGATYKGFPFVYYVKSGAIGSVANFYPSLLLLDIIAYYVLAVFISFILKLRE